MPAPINLAGRKIGRLTVKKLDPDTSQRSWFCRCDCGNEVIVKAQELLRGDTKSCGCLKRETTRSRGQNNRKHGNATEGKESAEYRTWTEMRRRCSNPNFIGFEYYGGRGISVCERWADFANFLADMGPKPSPAHSIDRIDPNGNYEPSNCRWATPKQQAQNRRRKATA